MRSAVDLACCTMQSKLRFCAAAFALFSAVVATAQVSQSALRFYGTGVGPPGQQDRVRIQIDDNVNAADASAPCDIGAGGFTIDFWLRGRLADNATASGGGDRETFDFNWIDGNIVVDRDIWGGSTQKWGISLAGGLVRFGTGRADSGALDSLHTCEGSTPVLDNAWHHIACVRDAASGVKRIYVDGVLDYETPPNRSRDDLSYPNAGVSGQLTQWGWYIVLAAEKHDAGPAYPSFNGYLDEVRLWNRALTAAEVAQHWNRILPAGTPGLVGYYRFEEGSGTSVADNSGADSPTGVLIAGVPGNGEWVSRALNVQNTAPVTGDPPPPAGMLTIESIPPGATIMVDALAVVTPQTITSTDGFPHLVTAPQTAVIGGTVHQFCCWSDGGARSHAVTALAAGRMVRAGYAPAGGATVTATVPAANRNADYSPAYGVNFANPFDAFGCCAGRESSGNRYQTAMQFPLPVPRGAAIASAVLTVRATADQSGAPSFQLRGYDAADLAPFVSGSAQPLTAHAPLLAQSITFTPPAWIAGNEYAFPDVTALVQPVVLRADWNAGQHAGIIVTDVTSAGDHWRCWRNFQSGQAPALTVTWTTPGAGCGADFDADGLPDSWESQYGLDCTSGADATLDPDGDGLDHRMEYALASHPFAPSPGALPQTGAISIAGESYTTLQFTRRKLTPPAALTPELSTNFTAWEAVLVPVSVIDHGESETVLVRDPLPRDARARLFLRLRFTPF
jgi:hypothetical protein